MATAYHLEALRRQRLIERKKQAEKLLSNPKNAEASEPPLQHETKAERPKSASVISDHSTAIMIQTPSVQQTTQTEESTVRPSSATATSRSASRMSQRDSVTNRTASQASRPSSQASRPISQASRPASANASSVAQSSAGSFSRPASAKSTTSASAKSSKSSLKTSRPASGGKSSQKSSGRNTIVSIVDDCTNGGRSTVVSSKTTKTADQPHSCASGKSVMSKISWTSKAELRADEVRKDLHKQEVVLRDSNLVMGDVPVEEELQLRKQELLA